MSEKPKSGKMKTTPAEEVVHIMDILRADDLPITSLDLDPSEFSKGDGHLQAFSTDSLISAMDANHAWAIFLDRDLVQTCVVNGKEQHFLIGYESGTKARRNETHFSQKEQDPVSHRLIFQPDPIFISYSFFYGFFGPTIRALCARFVDTNPDWNITTRKTIIKAFCDKYTFTFTQNPALADKMREYADIMIENIVDIQTKVGKTNGI